MNPAGLEALRKAYKCPCDGISDRTYGRMIVGPQAKTADNFLDHIEKASGYRPQTCAWFAYQTEIVQDLAELLSAYEWNPQILNDDMPHVLWEAIVWYGKRRNRTEAYWREIDDKKREEEERKSRARNTLGQRRGF